MKILYDPELNAIDIRAEGFKDAKQMTQVYSALRCFSNKVTAYLYVWEDPHSTGGEDKQVMQLRVWCGKESSLRITPEEA